MTCDTPECLSHIPALMRTMSADSLKLVQLVFPTPGCMFKGPFCVSPFDLARLITCTWSSILKENQTVIHLISHIQCLVLFNKSIVIFHSFVGLFWCYINTFHVYYMGMQPLNLWTCPLKFLLYDSCELLTLYTLYSLIDNWFDVRREPNRRLYEHDTWI
jgi:hypothetical protein